MASRLILKDIKSPIHFLLRNTASSAPSRAAPPLSQTLQNLLPPNQNSHSAGAFANSGGYRLLALNDRLPLSMDLKSTLNGGYRIEVRGKRQPLDDDGYQTDSYSDGFGNCFDVDRDGDAFDFDDADAVDRDEE